MKQILILLAGVSVFIIIVGVINKYPQQTNKAITSPGSFTTKTIETAFGDKKIIKVQEIELLVDVADTEEERTKGLSGRKSLGENEGMLFVFERKDIKPSFWMKGMLIPIDFIWINNDSISQINANIPPPDPDTPDRNLLLIIPDDKIDYVLEVAAGFSEKNSLKVGAPVDLSNLEGLAVP